MIYRTVYKDNLTEGTCDKTVVKVHFSPPKAGQKCLCQAQVGDSLPPIKLELPDGSTHTMMAPELLQKEGGQVMVGGPVVITPPKVDEVALDA